MSKHNVLNPMLYDVSLEARSWRLGSDDADALHWRRTSPDQDAVAWRLESKKGECSERKVGVQKDKTMFFGFIMLWTAAILCLLVAFPVALAIAGLTLYLQYVELRLFQ
tara:strand:+ start:139 stop:465 length:327 start_codon:yes stop_codon:yes gene_type:complete